MGRYRQAARERLAVSETPPVAVPLLRVTALQEQPRRRAGLEFTRNPRDLAPSDLGGGLAAGLRLAMLVEDPQLKVELVEHGEGGETRAISAEELADLQALLGAEAARVDPAAPPTPDAPAAEPVASGPVDAAPADKPKPSAHIPKA